MPDSGGGGLARETRLEDLVNRVYPCPVVRHFVVSQMLNTVKKDFNMLAQHARKNSCIIGPSIYNSTA